MCVFYIHKIYTRYSEIQMCIVIKKMNDWGDAYFKRLSRCLSIKGVTVQLSVCLTLY